jgi:uncharacterized protein YkwD
VERSSAYLWGAIGVVAGLLLVGAWLSTKAVAERAGDGGVAAAAAAKEYARYLASEEYCPGANELGAPVEQQQQTTMCMLNYARGVQGLGPLNASAQLMRSAQLKAEDIVRCTDFSHTACGLDVRQRFADSGYFRSDVRTAFGENLAWGGAEAGSPRGAVLGWLDSPKHRANLFKPEWTDQGIALAYVENFQGLESSRIWVSHFGHQG